MIKTDLIAQDFLVTYEVLRPDWKGGVSTVRVGPDGTGRPYTDFEDIRKIIAIRRGLGVADIQITVLTLQERKGQDA